MSDEEIEHLRRTNKELLAALEALLLHHQRGMLSVAMHTSRPDLGGWGAMELIPNAWRAVDRAKGIDPDVRAREQVKLMEEARDHYYARMNSWRETNREREEERKLKWERSVWGRIYTRLFGVRGGAT